MSRLALKPRYVERENLVGGGFELWTNPALPDGWTLVGGGNGTISRYTAEPFEETASGQIDKTASGTIYFVQPPRADVLPGCYYRIACARRPLQSGAPAQATARFVNITRNQCLNQSGAFVAGSTTNWVLPPAGKWFLERKWFQIPSTFADGDVYEFRIGNLTSSTSGTSWFDSCSLIGPYARPIHLFGLANVTRALQQRRRFAVLLITPSGVELDITRRLELDGFGQITEGAEEEILQLTHGDMTLTLDDRDRFLRDQLDASDETDRWELVILGETGRAHGIKWDRIFAGVLDLPWSVIGDPKDAEVELQVFSYTKALEQIPASSVARTFAGRRVSITAGTKAATTNSTTDLIRGDKVAARSGSSEEQFTVDRVSSATAFTVQDAAGTTFVDADLTLETFFLREKTAAYLAGAVCDAGGVARRSIDLDSDLADFPLAQPIAIHGLGLTAKPLSLVRQSGSLVATFAAADETKRKQTTGPTAPWTDGAITNNYQRDWTPYLLTEPGTIYDRVQLNPALSADSNLQYIITTGAFIAECVAYVAGIGIAVGAKLQLFSDAVIVGATRDCRLRLMYDGVFEIDVVVINVAGTTPGTYQAWIDYDTHSGIPWISYQFTPPGATDPTVRRLVYYETFAGTINTIHAAKSGQLRWCRALGPNGNMLFYDCAISGTTGPASAGELQFFDKHAAPEISLVSTIAFAQTIPLLWTFRAWSTFAAVLHTKPDGTYLSVWRTPDFAKLTEYRVSSKRETSGFLTITTLADGRVVGAGYAGGEWFVLSPRLDGVIPYADFGGLSCAGALKEIAVASVAYLDADRYNTVTLKQRPALTTAPAMQTLADPITQRSRPIWEFFRKACKVSGTDANGGAFSITQGEDGGSAKSLDISSPLVSTPAMAFAIALFYAAYLNRSVRQEDILIDEPDAEPVRVLDVVSFQGARWLVTQALSNPKEREQSLRLFEVTA